MTISDEDFRLLTVVNNSRKKGWDVSAETAAQLVSLIERGLVAKDENGHYVPDQVKWDLVKAQRQLK